MPVISFVVPVFNEAGNIPLLYGALVDQMKAFETLIPEFIFVNDGSYDTSMEVLKELSALDKRVKVISFTRNFGHQSALVAGMSKASGDAVITMDCDLQDPPQVVPQMLKHWLEGHKVVYTRRITRNDRLLKKLTARYYYKLLNWSSEVPLPGNIGDFRLIDRVVLKHFQNKKGKEEYLRGLIPWLGYKYAVVDYDRPVREKGKTGFNWLKMVRFAMQGILNFSLLPLRLGFAVGILSVFSGFVAFIYLLLNHFINGQFYKLLEWVAILNLILIGFLFILIWILAEYINGIKKEVKELPDFIIEETTNLDSSEN
ncbi:MAG: hypothetical protein BWY70_00484 [Bacteroidetes bacterium ADurb.Bin408]|nr:MAG: hypothetical protein BWY70_00484 [Bacteroidetes bacterium ADurb.Bin408]